MHRKRPTMQKSIQESLSSLRSRGGHCFPVRWAARLASRIATICFACDRVSSRRLASPPRHPIAARYSRTFFSVLVIRATNIYHKPLMMHAKFIVTFGRIVFGEDAGVRARHRTSPSDWRTGLALRALLNPPNALCSLVSECLDRTRGRSSFSVSLHFSSSASKIKSITIWDAETYPYRATKQEEHL